MTKNAFVLKYCKIRRALGAQPWLSIPLPWRIIGYAPICIFTVCWVCVSF